MPVVVRNAELDGTVTMAVLYLRLAFPLLCLGLVLGILAP